MGDGCLNNEHFEELGGILKGKLEEHFKNQELRQGETSLQTWHSFIFFPETKLCCVKHPKNYKSFGASSHRSQMLQSSNLT